MDLNFTLAYLGIALMVGISGIGSALGLYITGQSVVGAMRKDPTQMGKYIGLSALPASQGLYGFLGYFIASPMVVQGMSIQVAIAIIMLGLMLGIVCLVTAVRQGRILASGIAATADGHNVFASTMVMAAFPEFYAIIALLVTIMSLNAIG